MNIVLNVYICNLLGILGCLKLSSDAGRYMSTTISNVRKGTYSIA